MTNKTKSKIPSNSEEDILEDFYGSKSYHAVGSSSLVKVLRHEANQTGEQLIIIHKLGTSATIVSYQAAILTAGKEIKERIENIFLGSSATSSNPVIVRGKKRSLISSLTKASPGEVETSVSDKYSKTMGYLIGLEEKQDMQMSSTLKKIIEKRNNQKSQKS